MSAIKFQLALHRDQPQHFVSSKKQRQGTQLIFRRDSYIVLVNFLPVIQWLSSLIAPSEGAMRDEIRTIDSSALNLLTSET